MNVRPLILTLPLLLAACSTAPSSEAPEELPPSAEMEALVAEDLSSLGFGVSDAAAGPAESEERSDGPTCTATIGTCQVCTEVDGNLIAGTFAIEHTPLPCGWDVDFGNYTGAWTLTESWLEGAWTMTHWTGDYTLTAEAARASEYAWSTDSNSGGGAASFTGTLNATVEDYALAGWTVDLDYTGFAGHAWTLDAVAEGEALSGTVTLNDGAGQCTISGTVQAPTVDCAW